MDIIDAHLVGNGEPSKGNIVSRHRVVRASCYQRVALRVKKECTMSKVISSKIMSLRTCNSPATREQVQVTILFLESASNNGCRNSKEAVPRRFWCAALWLWCRSSACVVVTQKCKSRFAPDRRQCTQICNDRIKQKTPRKKRLMIVTTGCCNFLFLLMKQDNQPAEVE